MGIIKKPYEISLWEDILTFKYEDGTETEGVIENGHGPVVHQYYKERKMLHQSYIYSFSSSNGIELQPNQV